MFALLQSEQPLARHIARQKWTRRGAGIFGVVLLAWLTCPRPGVHSVGKLVLLAALSFGLTVAAAAVFRVATVAAWLPAFFYLWSLRSPWALVLIVIIATSAIRRMRRTSIPDDRPTIPLKELFTCSAGPFLTRRLAASFFAATNFLAAFVLAVWGWHSAATAVFLTGALTVLWHWTFPANRTGRWQIPAAAVILLVFLWPGFSGGGDSTTPQSAPQSAGRLKPPEKDEDIHSGIILWPEEEDHTVLVPPLPAMPRNLFGRKQRDPLSIPFYGVYWLFQPPHKKPPAASLRMRGDPMRSSFHSNGGRLTVEARQNFGRLIAASCCSRIKLAIRNRDRYPKSIKLELILLNSSQQQSRSLGIIDVKSAFTWQQIVQGTAQTNTPLTETIDFPVPPGTAPFDEIVIRFHLRLSRARISPRIAIDRFIFVPPTTAR